MRSLQLLLRSQRAVGLESHDPADALSSPGRGSFPRRAQPWRARITLRITQGRGPSSAGGMNAARSADGWQSLFWAAFNLSANPMIVLQPDRVLTAVNEAFLEAFGYSSAQALGRKLDVFVAEASRQRMKTDWWELLRTGRLNGQREMIRGDGRRARVQLAAHRETVTGRDLVLGVMLDLETRPMRCGKAPDDASAAALTSREREIVALVALGRRRREIADELFISEATVKTHLRNAMHKLDVHSQAQLVAVALTRGLIELAQHQIAEGSGSSRSLTAEPS
jgi:PAS domain S-box-containing protein